MRRIALDPDFYALKPQARPGRRTAKLALQPQEQGS
jgi:hypothetical protein